MLPLPPALNESSESEDEVIDSSQETEPKMPTGNQNCYKYRASIQKFTQTSFFTARKRAMSQVLDESEDEVIDSSQETEPKMPTGNQNCYKYRASIQKFTQTSFFTARKRAMSQVLDESEDEVIDSSEETEAKMPTGNQNCYKNTETS